MDYNIAVRRDGRAVECTGLENQQALIGLPGFESLSLRHYNQPFRRPCTRMYKKGLPIKVALLLMSATSLLLVLLT